MAIARVSPSSLRPSRRGFTLVELMIAMALSTMLIAAVLSTLLFFCRSGLAMADFCDAQRTRERVLATFSRDVWQAEEASWQNPRILRLSVDGATYIYKYQAKDGTLTRQGPDGSRTIAAQIETLTFRAFDISGTELPLKDSTTSTKMIQLEIRLSGSNSLTSAKPAITSSRYMLRNKQA